MNQACLYGLVSGALAVGVVALGTVESAAAADGWGSVKGQLVLEGEAPEPKLVIEKGDPQVKDADVCAAVDRYDQSLQVDEETNGIQHIFVWLRKKPSQVHPDLKEPEKEEIVFDQKHCRFKPHALVARTNQKVRVLSDDNCAHNTNTNPLFNNGDNILLPPNDRKGVLFSHRVAEPLPFEVACNIHPWMKAYWLVVDHPYAVVTDEQGRFKIENLPAGEHTFTMWQERSGYVPAGGDIGTDRGFTVTVKPGETVDLGKVKLPLDEFPANGKN